MSESDGHIDDGALADAPRVPSELPRPASGEGPFGIHAPDETEQMTERRDRLLAALTLSMGLGLLLALPFALKAGAEFFLPVTAALVIAVALVPVLEWLERHRLPAPLASFVCVIAFLTIANVALAAIVVPAVEFFRQFPERIGRIRMNLQPALDLYITLQKSIDKTAMRLAIGSARHAASNAAQTQVPPSSLVELIATAAPAIIIQIFFGALVVFFFLSGWTRLRRRTITSRSSFDGAMATARVIQDVVDDVSSYLGTITVINVSLGLVVAGLLAMFGMPYPLMWGGIVALLNYVPYFGPIVASLLIGIGGLMTFENSWVALTPAAIMVVTHLIESNLVTPMIVGHRLTINPIMILISLSFWSWVWGTAGALLAVPLLIIIQTVVGAAGKPDIAGFLFEHGTLGKREHREERMRRRRHP